MPGEGTSGRVREAFLGWFYEMEGHTLLVSGTIRDLGFRDLGFTSSHSSRISDCGCGLLGDLIIQGMTSP